VGDDCFASGFIHGILQDLNPECCLWIWMGLAHGALLLEKTGDTTFATLAEVKAFAGGSSASIQF